jgi:hypothetical protein
MMELYLQSPACPIEVMVITLRMTPLLFRVSSGMFQYASLCIMFNFVFRIIHSSPEHIPPVEHSRFLGELQDCSKFFFSMSQCIYDIADAKHFFVYTNFFRRLRDQEHDTRL